jgi:hypothetical protein
MMMCENEGIDDPEIRQPAHPRRVVRVKLPFPNLILVAALQDELPIALEPERESFITDVHEP